MKTVDALREGVKEAKVSYLWYNTNRASYAVPTAKDTCLLCPDSSALLLVPSKRGVCLTALLLLLISVKVISIQHDTGSVRFLFPMHNIEIIALHANEQESIGIEKEKFYKADFNKQGLLVVKVKKRRVLFIPKKLFFLEG